MPRPSNLRTRDLEWRRDIMEQRARHAVERPSPFHFIPIRNGITLHDLYTEVNKQRAARERQARLACCGLLPSVLALVLHLTW